MPGSAEVDLISDLDTGQASPRPARGSRTPSFRATVRRDGTVRIVDWGPWLATGGPLHTLLDSRGRAGVGIADLTVVRDDDEVAVEVIVDFRCGDEAAHRDSLRAWASRVGYQRVWFDGEIVELDPAAGGPAHTRCTDCRVRLIDADASFWEFVRHRGAFPTSCVLCGSDLPQWTPARQKRAGDRDPIATDTSRRTA